MPEPGWSYHRGWTCGRGAVAVAAEFVITFTATAAHAGIDFFIQGSGQHLPPEFSGLAYQPPSASRVPVAAVFGIDKLNVVPVSQP